MKNLSLRATVILVSVAFLASCFTPRAAIATPDGFSPYTGKGDVRLISPEGMRMRVRIEENEPSQSLDFWATALRGHMTDAGYTLVDHGTVSAAGGVWFEWVAPVHGEDWIYLTALRVSGNHIVVVESAAVEALYRTYRPALHAALPTAQVR